MIKDHIRHINRYGLPKADAIQRFISTHNCLELAEGQHLIEDHDLFVRVMNYIPKKTEDNNFETHETYADLQYIIQGSEMMQYTNLNELGFLTEYDKTGDYQFYTSALPTTNLIVNKEEFVFFYPKEPHRPSCAYLEKHGYVKKLVFKIRI